jgi:serine/threonine protein kinase
MPNTPFTLRAPEILLAAPSSSLTTKIDIWAIGCLAFEFLTGIPLFEEPIFEAPQDALDDLLLQMFERLGPLPGRQCEQYLEEGQPPQTIETYFTKMKHPDIDSEEADTIINLLRSILKYDQETWPSAEQILKHHWFHELG